MYVKLQHNLMLDVSDVFTWLFAEKQVNIEQAVWIVKPNNVIADLYG